MCCYEGLESFEIIFYCIISTPEEKLKMEIKNGMLPVEKRRKLLTRGEKNNILLTVSNKIRIIEKASRRCSI